MDEHELDPRLERTIRYAEGNMMPAEREAFERDLQHDGELRDELQAVRGTLAGLHQLGEERLRDRLREVERSMAGGGGSGGKRLWWAAAAVLLVAGVGLWYLTGKGSAEQLAEEHAFQEPGLPVLMSSGPQRMDAVMNAYKQDDLATAGQLIEAALERVPGNDTLLYFQAVVLERKGDAAGARRGFHAVPAGSVFADRAAYQLVLLQLRAGDRAGARQRLEGLRASADQPIAERARRLLKHL